MRTADTLLGLIRERGKKGLPLERVYKLLYNRDLYLMAYGKIYRNAGAMTHGVTDETPDGMSLAKIDALIEALRYERFHWLPVRRTYIPKKNGKKRPSGNADGSFILPSLPGAFGIDVVSDGSDLPTHTHFTVPYFARADESLVVSSGAELACEALR